MALPHLTEQTDPRNPIQKLSRQELLHLARYEKRDDIKPTMPGDLMRRRFMDKPPSIMPRPVRSQLGSQVRLVVPPYKEWCRMAFGPDQSMPQDTEVEETNALAALEKQWLAEQDAQTDFSKLAFQQLKKECKARSIKFSNKDNKAALLEKLNGHKDAA